MATSTVEVEQSGSKNLLDKSVLILLKLGKLGNSKKMKPEALRDPSGRAIEIDADQEFVRINKKLLEAPELVAITKLDSEIRAYIYSQCLPSFALEGVYILHQDLIDETEAMLQDFSERRRKAVEEFLMVYEQRVQEAAAHLRTAYDEDDYLPVEDVADQFTMEWRYLSMGVHDALKDHGDMYEREVEKSQAQIVAMSCGIRERLRGIFRAHIDKMVLKLEGEREGGRVKIFRNSLIENAVQFLDQYARAFGDLADDAELSPLVASAREILTEVSPDDLRANKDLRENVVAGLREIQAALDAMGVLATTELKEAA